MYLMTNTNMTAREMNTAIGSTVSYRGRDLVITGVCEGRKGDRMWILITPEGRTAILRPSEIR